MFQKRQAKLEKKKQNLKRDTIKKAGRCKIEYETYPARPKMSQRKLDKAVELIKKADTYFTKEMYKEAGKLYDRAYLTLRSKIH